MANLKISQLPAVSSSSNGDLYPLVQAGVTSSITFTNLQSSIASALMPSQLPAITLTGDITGSAAGGTIPTSLVATSNSTLTTLSALTTASSLSTIGTIISGTWNGSTIDIVYGGTGQTTPQSAFDALSPLMTAGDTLYYNGTHNVNLGIGTSGQLLTVVGGEPAWTSPATSGTVTSVSVVTTNGFAGTVATATTTPAITIETTITGILYGNGTAVLTAIAANFPILNQNTTGTAANITATTNSTLTTLSVLSLPYSQLTGVPTPLVFADSLVNTGGTVTLVNDTASPGNSYYYGTNGVGTLGYYSVSAAALSLGNLDAQAGTAKGAALVVGVLSMQSASASYPGLVNLAAQTFAGQKTLTNPISLSDGSNVNQTWTGPGVSGYQTWQWENTGTSLFLRNAGLSYFTIQSDNTGSTAFNGFTQDLASVEVNGLPSKKGLLVTNAATSPGDLANFDSNGGTTLAKIDNLGNITGANLSGTNTGDITLGTADGLSLSGQILSLALSSTSTTGALSSTDWNTFNNKQSTLTLGNLTDAGTDGITVTGGTGAVIGAGTSLSQHVADTTHNGYLSSTDWNTFNNKLTSVLPSAEIFIGNISNVATAVALSGDATLSNAGALTLDTVNSNVGSFGTSTSIPSFTVNAKGLITAASGNAVIAPAGTLTGTTLNSTVVSSSLTGVGTITSGVWNGTTIAISNGGTGQITANAAFNALSPMTTAGDLIYENATPTAARLPIGSTGQLLTVVGGEPAWATPATAGTVTSVSVVTTNGFAGTVATATTTPAITIETTITGILQGNGTAISAATTGNLTDAGTDGITVTGGTGAVIGTGASLSQHVADTTHNGYLSSTDWNTFNGKQAAGSYITALTGDGTASGPGSAALTLAAVNSNVGSFGSSTSIPSFTVNGKGLITAASGNVVIAPAGTLSGTTLNSTVVTSSLTAIGTITSGVWNGTATNGSAFLTSGTTYTTPANISANTNFKFTIIGGGGAGAGSTTAVTKGPGGGAGGTVIAYVTGLAASTGYTIAIGSGGTAASGALGGNGGNTTLTVGVTTYTAGGGTGGPFGSTLQGGAGGTTTNGTIGIPGQQGGPVIGTGNAGASGNGGNTMFGSGGASVPQPGSANTVGNAGTGYGSGGSGSASFAPSGSTGTGGNGAAGAILVEWQN